MRLRDIEKQEGSLELLKGLLEDKSRKVHGVFYDNSYFSQRYLTRSYALAKDINLEEDTLKLTIGTRVEIVGIMELENTLDMLVQHEAGDMPGFAPFGEQTDLPVVPEVVTPGKYLYTVDLVLILKNPTVTYQEFKIADTTFTLVTLKHTLGEDDLEQEIQLLFGEADKMYLFSHFYNKDLSTEEIELVLDFIVDRNITGKAIVAVKLESNSGSSSGIFPFEKLISSYTGVTGDYIFGATTGYIKIPAGCLKNYRLQLVPNEKSGSYRIELFHNDVDDTIKIYME
jgi:hypothetical protein